TKRRLRFRSGPPISLLFPLYTRRMKSCWVKTSLHRDHRPTHNFSRPLSNTGQSCQRSSATGGKSKMENLALPNFVRRKSILMQSCCVLSEASEKVAYKISLRLAGENAHPQKH